MKDMYKIVNTHLEQLNSHYKNIIKLYCQVGPNIDREYNKLSLAFF